MTPACSEKVGKWICRNIHNVVNTWDLIWVRFTANIMDIRCKEVVCIHVHYDKAY